jgi:hypothetical protein
VAVETPEQEALDDEAEDRHQHRRGDERAREADVIGELDGEVRTERVEGAVREVDQPAQREDQRQAERDQQVIRADQQAVDDLLEDLREDDGECPVPSVSIGVRRVNRGRRCFS